MQTPCVQVTIPLWRPLPVRVWAGIAGMVLACWHRGMRAWHARAQRPRPGREFKGLEGLDPRTLRDIGAPDAMVADAIEQRAMEARRIDGFGIWRGV